MVEMIASQKSREATYNIPTILNSFIINLEEQKLIFLKIIRHFCGISEIILNMSTPAF